MKHALTGLVALSLLAPSVSAQSLTGQPAQASDAYYVAARADLATRIAVTPNTGRARNIILFVGDGMGTSTLTAARIFQGQRQGVDGASTWTTMDRLPYAALVRTYSHDSLVADSAPSATALLTGVKARNDTVGVDHTVAVDDCAGSVGHGAVSLFETAEDAGLATGIVSTARITHATPAAAYAHTPQRDWEHDAELPAAAVAAGCTDIASQLIAWPHGDGFEVVLGGGRAAFLPKTAPDPEDPQARGLRQDGRDLIAEWKLKHPTGRYVWNRAQFDATTPARGEPLLGLFEPDHMKYEAERDQDVGGEPSLAEMTRKAIAALQQQDKGYVLLVEAGRIDHAHHVGRADLALADTVALDEAVAAALGMVDTPDTLVIVTADHSHNLTISGYPPREAPILGSVTRGDGVRSIASDGKGYALLSYASGPGAVDGPRSDVADIEHDHAPYPALVPMRSAAHGGEDVVARATGPWAHLLNGTIEQNLIYHIMAHALGEGADEPSTKAQD
ncbi:alkaline phosphatase [Brevundimonas sp.]|uniref:alkaline phosphatase n=1 Tax=Brevundimonas sp. TaxID=1871086 RepID=UPI0028A15E02|nr:alkaline phosphatase [Brevundimonas sp.]